MANTVISVDNLSKTYRLGVIGTGTFYGDLNRWWAKKRGKLETHLKIDETDHGNRQGETLWALKDVNFSVQQSEAVGIIGRNGAGKSTLLKILSQVTAPTSGAVRIKGRIASLLEVGTGFHPELTGRENIFLNGAIMGMSRDEIQRKFDEIVEFSGVEQFIDTPVKRYSSGMYVRLAFAVAAHLEPDILVIDEVLAVGDAEFQKKCLGKIEDVSQEEGRTVLFVSHNMSMITSLCRRAILLDQGSIVIDGSVSDAVHRYYNSQFSSPYSKDFTQMQRKIGDQYATLLEAHVEDESGKSSGEIDIRAPFKVKMRYSLHRDAIVGPYPNFHFHNALGQVVFVSGSKRPDNAKAGVYEAVCTVPGNLLNSDTYFIGLALTFMHGGIHVSFFEQSALAVVIRDPMDETLDDLRNGYAGYIPGAVRPKLDWIVKRIS